MKEAQCAATPLLGVIFDENLDFGMHIAERINKAYSMSSDITGILAQMIDDPCL